jgi:hypothetical protein
VIALVPYAANVALEWYVLSNMLTAFGAMVWWTIDADKQRSRPG